MLEEDMTAERPREGSIEERQVRRVIDDISAREERPLQTRWGRALKYGFAGGSIDPKAGIPGELRSALALASPEAPVSPEERERLERRAAYLPGLIERVTRPHDPEIIKRVARLIIAGIEEVAEMPDIQRLEALRAQVANKLQNLEMVVNDPEAAMAMGLAEEGLMDKVVVRPAMRHNENGFWEMEVSEGEGIRIMTAVLNMDDEAADILVKAITEDNPDPKHYLYKVGDKYILAINDEQRENLRRYKFAREILDNKVKEIIPAEYIPDQLKEMAKRVDGLKKEVSVRARIFIAYYLYRQSFFSLSALASLDGRYSAISTDEWKTLVTLSETMPGEMKFGDKIDMALRILALLAIGGGQGSYEDTREENIRRELAKQPEDIKILFAEGSENFKNLVKHAKKNIFVEPGQETSTVSEIRKWIRQVIGRDESDTKAAEELAYRLFFMWGLAAYFDNRVWVEGDEEEGGKTFFAPEGPAISDETANLMHLEAARRKFRYRERTRHGPDATMGQYPDMMSSFLHTAGVGRGLEFKSLWTYWWENGIKLGKEEVKDENERVIEEGFPWERIGNAAWFRYNFKLSFAGAKETGLYDMIMRPLSIRAMSKDDMVEFLRALYKTVDKAVTETSIHGGDPKAWLAKQRPEDIKRWQEEHREQTERSLRRQTPEKVRKFRESQQKRLEKWMKENPGKDPREMINFDLRRQVLAPLKERIRELILIGAITSEYQNNSMEAMRGWGEWATGDATAAGNTREIVSRVMKQAGWGDKKWWEKKIKDPAEKFLKPEGLV